MKTKSFQAYLEKRLDKDEIAEIRQQAQSEIRLLKSLVGTHGKFPMSLWKIRKSKEYILPEELIIH